MHEPSTLIEQLLGLYFLIKDEKNKKTSRFIPKIKIEVMPYLGSIKPFITLCFLLEGLRRLH